MKEKERRLLEQGKQKDEYVAKLKERIGMLEQEGKNPSSHLQEKYDKLKQKYNDLQDSNDSKNQHLYDKVHDAEKARDRFRNQTLEQKQEIRNLKTKMANQFESTTIDYDEDYPKHVMKRDEPDLKLKSLQNNIQEGLKSFRGSSTNRENNKELEHSSGLMNSQKNRKAEVINDIKSLIQDFKKDKKPLTSSR